jgi:ribosome-binding protein aMBF1 (putative translation factor)
MNIYVHFLFRFFFALAEVQNITDKEFLKSLGLNLKKLRKQKKISQLELAVRMNNHPEQISRIERGLHNVTICTLKKIADELEVSIAELISKE